MAVMCVFYAKTLPNCIPSHGTPTLPRLSWRPAVVSWLLRGLLWRRSDWFERTGKGVQGTPRLSSSAASSGNR